MNDTQVIENNVIALRPKEEEETFEKFIEDTARKILDGFDLQEKEHSMNFLTSILEDVFDNGLGMGYTMCEMDFKDHFDEFFEGDFVNGS